MILIAAVLAVSSVTNLCDAAPVRRPSFDASLLKTGAFTYEYRVKGKHMGRFVIRVLRGGADRWLFAGDGGGQHWESLATADMQPISATLQFRRAGHPYRMELAYGPTSVTYVETVDGVAGPQRQTSLPPWIVDQRVDWAAAMASNLQPNQSVSFAVFDPATGVSIVRAVASGRVALPGLPKWGRLAKVDYRVCKNGGEENYTVFSTARAPSILVREHLRDDEVDTLTDVKVAAAER